eukprot:scaffold7058_cov398-Pinguiococcus_pyrenoidosus.AAC.1
MFSTERTIAGAMNSPTSTSSATLLVALATGTQGIRTPMRSLSGAAAAIRGTSSSREGRMLHACSALPSQGLSQEALPAQDCGLCHRSGGRGTRSLRSNLEHRSNRRWPLVRDVLCQRGPMSRSGIVLLLQWLRKGAQK